MSARQCQAWTQTADRRCLHPPVCERIAQGGIRLLVCASHRRAARLYPHWWTRAERVAP